jgi:type I restriction enzyme S subunit
VKLSDVAVLSSGGTPSKANAAFWDGDIPWVSPKDMKFDHITDAEDKITRAAVSESAAKIVGSNSVLAVVRSGILAHTFPVATVARDVSFNQDIKAITPKNISLLPAFLFWMLKGQEAQILRIGVKKGATVHSLANSFLESLRFPLPPLDEQRRIVGLLDRAAEIRRRADAARAKARAIIPALFLDTFGDPATNPKGWPVVTVGDAGEVKLGRQRAPKYQSGKFTRPYVRVANVFENRIDVSDLLSMDFDERDFATYLLSYGDILLNEGQSIELVGRPAMWRDEVRDCCFQNTLLRFRCDPAKIVPEFALAAFLRMYQDGQLSKIASKTSNVAHLGASRFAKLPIVLPDLPLQAAFSEQAKRLHVLARALDAAVAKAETMAAALLAEVFEK